MGKNAFHKVTQKSVGVIPTQHRDSGTSTLDLSWTQDRGTAPPPAPAEAPASDPTPIHTYIIKSSPSNHPVEMWSLKPLAESSKAHSNNVLSTKIELHDLRESIITYIRQTSQDHVKSQGANVSQFKRRLSYLKVIRV